MPETLLESTSARKVKRRAIRRAVVVDDPALAADLRPLVEPQGEVVAVECFLDAIGEAGGGSVDAVLGPAHALTDIAGSTADSLRRLVPEARLLLTRPESDREATREALAAGFDAAIDEVDAAGLAEALGLPYEAGFDEAIDDDAAEEDGESAAALPPGETLGDTDLVEAVMRGRGEVRDLALRVARERSGIGGLALMISRDERPPSDHATCGIDYQGIPLGTLHAPAPADEADLGPWAHWLARWLGLDQQHAQLRDLSLRDELTGVWNRRYFNRFLARILQRAADDRQQVTLMVFDIDDFKHYNDTYGHPAGDEILREIASLMRSTVREHDVVARIGGDEFAVIFWDAGPPRTPHSRHPQNVLAAAKRFQKAVCEHRFPKLQDRAAGSLTISAGLAGFPWDGRTPDDLLYYADQMALQSKRQGKNAISFGPNACYDGGSP